MGREESADLAHTKSPECRPCPICGMIHPIPGECL